jgi:hypothetical protein
MWEGWRIYMACECTHIWVGSQAKPRPDLSVPLCTCDHSATVDLLCGVVNPILSVVFSRPSRRFVFLFR